MIILQDRIEDGDSKQDDSAQGKGALLSLCILICPLVCLGSDFEAEGPATTGPSPPPPSATASPSLSPPPDQTRKRPKVTSSHGPAKRKRKIRVEVVNIWT